MIAIVTAKMKFHYRMINELNNHNLKFIGFKVDEESTTNYISTMRFGFTNDVGNSELSLEEAISKCIQKEQ